MARAFVQGDYDTTFLGIGLNVYPLVLAGLHGLRLDWLVAAKLWGILTAGLTILPLYGWVRRLYNERIAAATCFLFAVHPTLIELSVEPMRESTFWLLFSLTIYLTWRGLEERRAGMLTLAGAVFALAIHTRTEAWLLAAPISLWLAFRWWEGGRRQHLAAGMCLFAAMTPLLIVATNLVVLSGHSQWEFGRLRHFERVWQWMTIEEATPATPAVATSIDAAVASEAPAEGITATPKPTVEMAAGPLTREYVNRLNDHQNPVFHALLLVGVVLGWRTQRHRDRLALIPVAAAVPVAVVGYLLLWGAINSRYFLTLFFVLGPLEAIALLALTDRVVAYWRRRDAALRVPRIATALVLAGLAVGLSLDALEASHSSRATRAALGDWIQETHGPFSKVVVDPGASIVGQAAQGELPFVHFSRRPLEDEIEREQPGLIVLTTFRRAPFWGEITEDEAVSLGYRMLDAEEIPPGLSRDYLLYLRDDQPN